MKTRTATLLITICLALVTLVVVRGLVAHAYHGCDFVPLEHGHDHEPLDREVAPRQALLGRVGFGIVVDKQGFMLPDRIGPNTGLGDVPLEGITSHLALLHNGF